MSTGKKALIVIVGSLALSVLGIQASDTLRGLDTQLVGLVTESAGPCGAGATQILLGSHALCVDIFEASASAACPHAAPTNQTETQSNLNEASCLAESKADAQPWRFISLTQAQQVCARSGKRLPTNEEWYRFASGIADDSVCVIDNNSPLPTGKAGCVTPAGIHDTIGNVWEWIDGEVINGTYNNRTLPPSGYVALVDSDGVVVETANSAHAEYGADYAWAKPEGISGMIRGGFYGSKSDAGIFAQNLTVPLDFKTAGVGFRCARDL